MPDFPDRHLQVTYKHETFLLFPGHSTPAFSRECRRVTGLGIVRLWDLIMSDAYFEPDTSAFIIWAARAQTADRLGIPELALSLQEIEESITYNEIADHLKVELKGMFDEKEDVVETAEDDETKNKLAEAPADPEG